MKKGIFCLIAALALCLLWGCQQEDAMITQLTFDRGSGSTWGSQFYIQLSPEQILQLRYIPEGSTELVTREQLPIDSQTWQALLQLLEELTLEKADPLKGLLGGKADGADYRRLTVTYGSRQVTYRWPENGEKLEEFLENLGRSIP